MTSAAPVAARCRACAANLAAGSAKCDRCGALQRDDVVCPHCGAHADASPHLELRFACDICGAPRVPSQSREGPGGASTLAPLQEAERARRGRAMWRAAAVASGLSAPFLLAVTIFAGLVLHAPVFALFFTVFALLPTLAMAVFSGRRSAARTREISRLIDAAWLAAATQWAERTGGMRNAAGLAAALRTTDAHAEELLALVSVGDFLRGDVAPLRARIDVPVAAPGGTRVMDAAGSARAAEASLEAAEALHEAEADPALRAKRLS